MTLQEFEKLIDKDKYQVFVFISPGSIPISFALHPWFVVNKKGEISRWEVMHFKNLNKTSWGHLYKDFLLPFQGIRVMWPIFGLKFFSPRWSAKLLKIIEGDENSTAKKMVNFIENSPQAFPYCNEYHFFPGPNSDTYGQWVLDHFPELNIKLPWNCFGKNYKK